MTRSFQIGMPQMAAGCLSENWLLKELGSLHWDTLCNSLGAKSADLSDSRGRRLYATFVRIRLDLTQPLTAFKEGDEIALSIAMSRFGRSTLHSTIAIKGTGAEGLAEMLSTFSVRADGESNTLTKSEPIGEYRDIASAQETPAFLTEYSSARSKYSNRSDPQSAAYRINPYVDSNGANLLYFAAYQSIADFLSRDVGHTKRRDIFYFKNCELTDAIYMTKLSDQERLLFRSSDRACIAFTRKETA